MRIEVKKCNLFQRFRCRRWNFIYFCCDLYEKLSRMDFDFFLLLAFYVCMKWNGVRFLFLLSSINIGFICSFARIFRIMPAFFIFPNTHTITIHTHTRYYDWINISGKIYYGVTMFLASSLPAFLLFIEKGFVFTLHRTPHTYRESNHKLLSTAIWTEKLKV